VHRIDRWWRADLQKLRREAIHALCHAISLLDAEGPQGRQRALRTLELMLKLRDRVIRRTAHEPNGTGRPRQRRNEAEPQRLARRPLTNGSRDAGSQRLGDAKRRICGTHPDTYNRCDAAARQRIRRGGWGHIESASPASKERPPPLARGSVESYRERVKLRLPHVVLILLAIPPGYVGIAALFSEPSYDSTRESDILSGVPWLLLAVLLVGFALWSAWRRG
jgi:hypothetical protein